ncbi:MAG: hypothetical protein K2X71_29125, partial [Methylobacterium sp.]|nr:hypothetical protein [Methylobacterium sp.]
EFLFRGRPGGEAAAASWHVILGQVVTPPGGGAGQFVASGALTPAQAAAGLPLERVLRGIETAALAERDAAVAALAAMTAERDALRAEIAALAAGRAAPPVPGASERPSPSAEAT